MSPLTRHNSLFSEYSQLSSPSQSQGINPAEETGNTASPSPQLSDSSTLASETEVTWGSQASSQNPNLRDIEPAVEETVNTLPPSPQSSRSESSTLTSRTGTTWYSQTSTVNDTASTITDAASWTSSQSRFRLQLEAQLDVESSTTLTQDSRSDDLDDSSILGHWPLFQSYSQPSERDEAEVRQIVIPNSLSQPRNIPVISTEEGSGVDEHDGGSRVDSSRSSSPAPTIVDVSPPDTPRTTSLDVDYGHSHQRVDDVNEDDEFGTNVCSALNRQNSFARSHSVISSTTARILSASVTGTHLAFTSSVQVKMKVNMKVEMMIMTTEGVGVRPGLGID